MTKSTDGPTKPIVVVLMGVAGAGKTTVGRKLASRMGWRFADADDFHGPGNVEKMAAGRPLSDTDREQWLLVLRRFIDERIQEDEPTVLACSALKAAYRKVLGTSREEVQLVYLRGSYEKISERLGERSDHFFEQSLLSSQFEALEPPDGSEALIVDINRTPQEIAASIEQQLAASGTPSEPDSPG